MEDRASMRPRKSAQFKAEVVSSYHQSGLSLRQFALLQGLGYTTLRYWVEQSRPGLNPAPQSETALVEVPNLLGTRATSSSPYRVLFPHGLVLEVEPGFDAAELSRLARSLLSV